MTVWARSYTSASTPPQMRSCPGRVLAGASWTMSSGCWCHVDHSWLSDQRTTTPAPLRTQSPPSPCCMEHQPEPTADGEPAPATTDEPSPRGQDYLSVTSQPWRSTMNCLSPLSRPCSSFPCSMRSLCWESLFGVCGQHTPSLKPPTVMKTHPASLSHLLSWAVYHLLPCCRCILPVPQLILSILHLWSGFASGLSVSSSTVVGGSPVSASNLRDPDSASACRPIGSTMAPSSLLSAGIPRPSDSALVSRRPALASGLYCSRPHLIPLSLWLSWAPPSLPLAPPWSSVTPAPSRSSGSRPAPRSPEPSALADCVDCVDELLFLFVDYWF